MNKKPFLPTLETIKQKNILKNKQGPKIGDIDNKTFIKSLLNPAISNSPLQKPSISDKVENLKNLTNDLINQKVAPLKDKSEVLEKILIQLINDLNFNQEIIEVVENFSLDIMDVELNNFSVFLENFFVGKLKINKTCFYNFSNQEIPGFNHLGFSNIWQETFKQYNLLENNDIFFGLLNGKLQNGLFSKGHHDDAIQSTLLIPIQNPLPSQKNIAIIGLGCYDKSLDSSKDGFLMNWIAKLINKRLKILLTNKLV